MRAMKYNPREIADVLERSQRTTDHWSKPEQPGASIDAAKDDLVRVAANLSGILRFNDDLPPVTRRLIAVTIKLLQSTPADARVLYKYAQRASRNLQQAQQAVMARKSVKALERRTIKLAAKYEAAKFGMNKPSFTGTIRLYVKIKMSIEKMRSLAKAGDGSGAKTESIRLMSFLKMVPVSASNDRFLSNAKTLAVSISGAENRPAYIIQSANELDRNVSQLIAITKQQMQHVLSGDTES